MVPLKETDISGPERHARDAIEQHGRRGLGRVSHALALRDKRGHLHANATPRYVRARIRNIVPVVLDGFEFPVAESRLDRLSALQHYNGLRVHTDYFPEGMSKMREKFLNVPLAAVIHPLSPSATLAAQEQASAAVNAPPITELELKESEQPRYVFVVKFKYQDGAERIEGTRAEGTTRADDANCLRWLRNCRPFIRCGSMVAPADSEAAIILSRLSAAPHERSLC